MRAKPVRPAPSPAAVPVPARNAGPAPMPARLRDASSATPARDACPAKGQPKRCTLALCRRRRACAHPPAPESLDPAQGPLAMDARYREFAKLVMMLVDSKGHNPFEIMQAGDAAIARRRRKGARRAERAALAGSADAAATRATRKDGPDDARPLICRL